MFDIVDTALEVMEENKSLLISPGFLQGKWKYLAIDMQCTYCVFTLWGSNVPHVPPIHQVYKGSSKIHKFLLGSVMWVSYNTVQLRLLQDRVPLRVQ